jgi:hypothetical protein
MKTQSPDVPEGIFCIKIKSEMGNIFASPKYKSFGAKMMPL